jgi:hypothetical protein
MLATLLVPWQILQVHVVHVYTTNASTAILNVTTVFPGHIDSLS